MVSDVTSPLPVDLVRVSDLDDAWRQPTPGVRLDAVRAAARRFGDRLRAGERAVAVRTYDMVTLPYPASFGLAAAATSPAPYLFLRNRMQLVQVRSGTRLLHVLVNPSDPERAARTPYFARLAARYGEKLSRRWLATIHGSVAAALPEWGLVPGDIDYVTFDHLHTQDLRGLLGTATEEPLLPRARLLVQRAERLIFSLLHPLQADWYIRDALAGVPPDRIVVLDGDYLLGSGLALLRTPGHTAGNHSIAVYTDRGIWTISENGVCADSYAPTLSRIPGIARHAREADVEVLLNSNTREGSLDQYTSMILEKTLADAVPDRPELAQHFPSSEMVAHPLAPWLTPSYSHGAITHGTVVRGRTSPSL